MDSTAPPSTKTHKVPKDSFHLTKICVHLLGFLLHLTMTIRLSQALFRGPKTALL